MSRFIFTFNLFLFATVCAFAQQDSAHKKPTVVKYVWDGKDSMPVYEFDEVILDALIDSAARAKYLRLVRDVKKALPYAKMASFRLQLMQQNLEQITDKKERKRYMKASEKAIKEEFMDDLKNLSVNQGRILIKLLHRETGRTSYDILSSYTNPFTTFFWNTAAKVYGGDLKNTYDPVEDYQIEYIIKNQHLE